jgi:hypothetical protein
MNEPVAGSPKEELYRNYFDPFAEAFNDLTTGQAYTEQLHAVVRDLDRDNPTALINNFPATYLPDVITAFEGLQGTLAMMAAQRIKLDPRRLKEIDRGNHIIWNGIEEPPPDCSDEEMSMRFRLKLRRNALLGVSVALLLAKGGQEHASEQALQDDPRASFVANGRLMNVLQRSISLPNSLATLHDDEEGRRLDKRVRPLGASRHPYIRLGHIAAGKIYLPTTEFVIRGEAPYERIRLKPEDPAAPKQSEDTSPPVVVMCPMVRLEDKDALAGAGPHT